MPIRKSVVVVQIGLVLLAVLFLNAAVSVLSRPSTGAKGISVQTYFELGILCVSGCLILLLFVRYKTPMNKSTQC